MATTYEIAGHVLDIAAHTLSRDGTLVHVEPQVFDLVALLAQRAPALVTYDDLVAEVWGGRIVSDATIAARISAARAALGDDGKRQAVIRTHARRGLQLVAAVTVPGAGKATDSPGPQEQQVIRYARSRDGTAIAWAATGAGPPLLRGGHWMSHLEQDWTSPVFRPTLDRLSRGRRLIRYDPRGTGLSDLTPGDGSLEAYVDDMAAVADAAHLDRFAIYAISQSVPISIAFAARYPDRVDRMILHNGFAQGEMARGEHEKTEALVAMIRAGWGKPGSAFMKAVATVFMPLSKPADIDSLVDTQRASATPEMAADLRRRIAAIDVGDLLSRVRCPVLVAHCEGDAVQPVAQSRRIASGIADARLSLVASPNHVVSPSDPAWDGCMQGFERFLGEDHVSPD